MGPIKNPHINARVYARSGTKEKERKRESRRKRSEESKVAPEGRRG